MNLRDSFKNRRSPADTSGMIISDEQARRAAQYLRESDSSIDPHAPVHPEISNELLGRVRDRVEEAPDVRPERLAEAREMLDAPPSASDVASKMLSRIISDALR